MIRKAIVAGHICIDITPVFPQNSTRVSHPGELLKPGKLIQTEAPEVHAGGAVANTGLGMKRMGADVRLMGKVGDDAFGKMIREMLNRYGAGDDLLVEPGGTTSYSVVLAMPGIDRIFLHCPGANDTFDGTEIPDSVLAEAAVFHFGYPPLMKSMFADEGVHLAAMFRRVHAAGVATSLDLAAVDPESEAGKADWESILAKVLPEVDFFVPSFEELCFMLDRPRYIRLCEAAQGGDLTEHLSVEGDIQPLARKCLSLGAGAVLLKCGAPGLYLQTSDSMDRVGRRLELNTEKWQSFSRFEKSYRVDRVLSGTGAGDISIAAFLTSLLEGRDPRSAVENAAAAGALCCMSYDAVSGLMPLEDIRRKIDQGWEKRHS